MVPLNHHDFTITVGQISQSWLRVFTGVGWPRPRSQINFLFWSMSGEEDSVISRVAAHLYVHGVCGAFLSV